MKVSYLLYAVLALALAGAGCASNPVERKEDTVKSLNQTRDEMADVRSQIDETLASLNALMTAPPEDLRGAYQQYAKNVNAMRSDADAMQRRAADMRKNTNNYLTGWREAQSQVQNPELRDVSVERRQEIAARFAHINSAFLDAQQAVTPFLQNLEDVRRIVGNDLTPGGVSAIAQTDVVQNANANGEEVAQNLDQAITQFDALTGRLAPTQ